MVLGAKLPSPQSTKMLGSAWKCRAPGRTGANPRTIYWSPKLRVSCDGSGSSCAPTLAATGVFEISVVAFEDASGRCVTSLQMTFSITQWLPGTDDRDPYFANILVDKGPLRAMVHPASSHSRVLRAQVNEQVTLWANELARRG